MRPNWVFFGPGHDAERGLDDLIRSLEEDFSWRDMHTRLTVQTKEWTDAGRDRSFLLRGNPLRSAEEWLSQATQHEKTAPTALQTEYILASRKASNRTQRTWRVGSVAFSPDDKTLASGSNDDTIRPWDVADLLDIVPNVCALAGRYLTHAEWH